ncbi:MAG: cyclic nucleotide-binding domain-containing protein [Proteobacteria bacterium]|nr:cyclic nucleotide-binding domain-containing protein [Pseudomonadota bacterium]
MLTIQAVPEVLEHAYKAYKKLSKEIFEGIGKKNPPEKLPANTNVLAHVKSADMVYVIEGYFKLNHKEKTVRLYSDSDFITSSYNFDNMTLTNEFASTVSIFDRAILLKKLRKNEHLFERWVALQELDSRIALSLVSANMPQQMKVSFKSRQYKAGEVIVKEGDSPTELYEMISGSGYVSLAGKEVGKISHGEIFGEVSFLTQRPRTATVMASNDCLVRVVDEKNFSKLLATNSHLILTIAKTLAKRVVETNERLLT